MLRWWERIGWEVGGSRLDQKHRSTTVLLYSHKAEAANRPPTESTNNGYVDATDSPPAVRKRQQCCTVAMDMLPHPDVNKTTTPWHLWASFPPGLHYEAQRKSSLAIWKNLQDNDAAWVMPHWHKEQPVWNTWIRSDKIQTVFKTRCELLKYLRPLWFETRIMWHEKGMFSPQSRQAVSWKAKGIKIL